jgi:predicted DNA-binding antitoxin AbrB/MazE fold protein
MRVRAIYRDEILKPKKKLALAEGEEVTIEIRKSKVDNLAGLLEDIDIDSVELQHRMKKVLRGTLEGKYHHE